MEVRYLLDTHTLLWWLFDSPELSGNAKKSISAASNHIIVSSVSAWEISIKHRLGKLPKVGDILEKLPTYIRKERFEVLPISIEHGVLAGSLPDNHRDPFDRMLIAQAKLEHLSIITTDKIFKNYGIRTVW